MQIWILQVVCGNIHIYQNTEQKQVEDLNDKQCNYNNRRHVSVICHSPERTIFIKGNTHVKVFWMFSHFNLYRWQCTGIY